MMFSHSTLFSIFLVFLISSCTSPKKNIDSLKNCSFEILSLDAKNILGKGFPLKPGIELNALMKISNPNPSEVSVYEFAFDILLETSKEKNEFLAKLVNNEERIIPPMDSSVFSVTIKTDPNAAWDEKMVRVVMLFISEVVSGQSPNVIFDGVVKYDTIFGKISIPYKETKPILKFSKP